jgi:hypothetical protein
MYSKNVCVQYEGAVDHAVAVDDTVGEVKFLIRGPGG